mgnify:CR=1 FL=1
MRTGENIYKRKDGRWEARIGIGRQADGRLQYKSFYSHTYQEVKLKKQEYEQTFRQSACKRQTNKEETLYRDIACQWLDEGRKRWKESTYVKYCQMMHGFLLPYFQRVRLWEINQKKYDQFMEELLKVKNCGQSTLNLVNTVFMSSLKYASKSLKTGYLPWIQLHHGRTAEREIQILTSKENGQLLAMLAAGLADDGGSASAFGKNICAGLLVARYTGIRLGELCALRWSEIDMEENSLKICRTLQRLSVPEEDREKGAPKTRLVFGTPKNGKKRIIPLHEQVAAFLQNCQIGHRPEDYLLTGSDRPMEPRTCTNYFKRMLCAAGVRQVNFHVLRHTFATECVEAGINIQVLSEILGHSSIRITTERYVHLSMQYKQNQIGILAVAPILSAANVKLAS